MKAVGLFDRLFSYIYGAKPQAMKKTSTLLVCAILAAHSVYAQSGLIYSISTGPGEDASTQMCISWATDTTVTASYILYTLEGDGGWDAAIKAPAQEQRRCDIFNGAFSDTADGKDCYEDAVFIKYGTILSGLEPDTDYKYVIETKDGERSSEHHFRTAGAKKWSACIISDFHSWPPLQSRLDCAMSMIDTMAGVDPSLDFIFCPGDVVAYGTCYSFWRRLFEERGFENYMWARVNGNHDNWSKLSVKNHEFDLPNHFFTATSYYPHNSYAGELGVCYHFRYGNTLFIMLNSEDMSEKKGEFDAAVEWARSVVSQARKSANPPTFVVACMHYEWFIGTNGRTSQYGRWAKVFDELGVDLAVAGNNHVYLRTLPLYQGQKTDGKRNGTVYLQTSSSDNGRGRAISETEFQNPDLIENRWSEGSKTVSAIHMAVDSKSISLTLLDRNGNKVDNYVLKAKKR